MNAVRLLFSLKFVLTGFLLLVLVITVAAVAHAQLKPESQTGSFIPVKPEALDRRDGGIVRKEFARCVYRRSKAKVVAFLNNSDPVTVIIAKDSKTIGVQRSMDECLGREVRPMETVLQMRFTHEFLRDLMAEEAYLATNETAPQLPPAPLPLQQRFVSTGEDLLKAQGIASFTDCAILRNVSHADALLRTMPGSREESVAAKTIAPALGACLVQGQNVKLTAGIIRGLVAFAMWTRFGREATSQ